MWENNNISGWEKGHMFPASACTHHQQQGGYQQQPAQQGGQQQGFKQQPAQQNKPQQAKAPYLDDGWSDDIPF